MTGASVLVTASYPLASRQESTGPSRSQDQRCAVSLHFKGTSRRRSNRRPSQNSKKKKRGVGNGSNQRPSVGLWYKVTIARWVSIYFPRVYRVTVTGEKFLEFRLVWVLGCGRARSSCTVDRKNRRNQHSRNFPALSVSTSTQERLTHSPSGEGGFEGNLS